MYRVHRRFLAGLTGLIFLFGSAPSRALTYDVNVVAGINSVTGTITTNGHFGALSSTDIIGWSLVIHTGPFSAISHGYKSDHHRNAAAGQLKCH